MISKEQLLKSIIHELNVCKHLYLKIPPDFFGYRPTANMRSTLELLQYLSFAPYEFAFAMVNDSFRTNNWSSYSDAEKKALTLKAGDFTAAVDTQIEKFKHLFAELNENDLIRREITPGWSPNITLGAALIDHSLKVVTAYRMQLFIYLKSTVAPELHSGNCWSGMD